MWTWLWTGAASAPALQRGRCGRVAAADRLDRPLRARPSCLRAFLWECRSLGLLVAEARQDLAGVHLKETLLLIPDLLDVELIEACVRIGLDRLELSIGIRATRNVFAGLLGGHHLAGLFEMCGCWQNLRELPG